MGKDIWNFWWWLCFSDKSLSFASQESPSGVQNSQGCPVKCTTSGKKTPYTRGLCGDMSHHMCHYMLTPTSSILLWKIQWTTEKTTVDLDLWQQRLLAPLDNCLFCIPPRSCCKAPWLKSSVICWLGPEKEPQTNRGTLSPNISFLVRFHI
jgi:hypothetical protein